jgi:hypothetical protein
MNNENKQNDEAELPSKLEFEVMDTSGMWFAAAAVFAILAAGVIVYRAANDDIRIALSDTVSAPPSNLR